MRLMDMLFLPVWCVSPTQSTKGPEGWGQVGRVMIEKIAQKVNGNEALLRSGRFVTLDFVVGIGETDYLVSVREGRIDEVKERRLQTHSGVFAVRAARDTWSEH